MMTDDKQLNEIVPDDDVPKTRSHGRRVWRLKRSFLGLLLFLAGYLLWTNQSLARELDVLLGRASSLPLTARERKRMQEIADLVLDLYQTIGEMDYIVPADIKLGPHNITYVGRRSKKREHINLDPALEYLYSIFPYLEDNWYAHRNFFQGSSFIDFRNWDHLRRSRNPFDVFVNPETGLNEEDGPYMQPWVTPLSRIGVRPIVILYDARKHRVWVIDKDEWRSADLALKGAKPSPVRGANAWAFDHLPSRPAPDVLKDMKQWYSEFRVFPQSLGLGEVELPEDLKYLPSLFRKHGWPDSFDKEAFRIEKLRIYSAKQAAWEAQEPLRTLKKLEDAVGFTKHIENQESRIRCQAACCEPDEMDWNEIASAYISLQKDYCQLGALKKQLFEAQKAANLYCPLGVCQMEDDLPLWEQAYLEIHTEKCRESLDYLQQQLPSEYRERHLRIARRNVALSENALEASRTAAKNLQPKGHIKSQVAYARRKPNKFRLESLKCEYDAASRFGSQYPESPDVQGHTRRALEEIKAALASYPTVGEEVSSET